MRKKMKELAPTGLMDFEESFKVFQAFALCPLDGRYAEIMEKSMPYFSEYALVEGRVKVEVFWLKFLLKQQLNSKILMEFNQSEIHKKIEDIYNNFNLDGYYRVKEIEKEKNHDVKAVELYVAEKLQELGFDALVSYVHIGCTSEDITNPSYANNIKEFLNDVWIPEAWQLIQKLANWAVYFKGIPMLAHTHGQPATPTTLGKEIFIFCRRLRNYLGKVEKMMFSAKLNGATGNYSAIDFAFPEEDWMMLSKNFVEQDLGLNFNAVTTQIENHDYICDMLDYVRHFDNIVSGLDLDMWLYISKEYFKQKVVEQEVGSSTMPHKVNPIKFENSESNVSTGNGLNIALSEKLPKSRMQRDLSDSSSLRNVGMALGYSLLAIESTSAALSRATINKEKIASDLEDNWEVLAEPIQTMLRKYGVPDAYDQLKKLTRGKRISKQAIHEFVNSQEIFSEEDKKALLELTPATYIGLAEKIVNAEIKNIF